MNSCWEKLNNKSFVLTQERRCKHKCKNKYNPLSGLFCNYQHSQGRNFLCFRRHTPSGGKYATRTYAKSTSPHRILFKTDVSSERSLRYRKGVCCLYFTKKFINKSMVSLLDGGRLFLMQKTSKLLINKSIKS